MAKAPESDTSDLDPSEFESPASNDDDGSETQKIDLDGGEHYIGEITDAELTVGNHGLIEIDGKTFWLNASTLGDLVSNLLVGEPVMAEAEEEEQSFTSDGETVTYHQKHLRFTEAED